MSFRKLCHMPFRKLIPPFTLTVFGGLNFGIKKTRPTETGTLRISHTSPSLIGERANKRRSFKNAKLHSWKLQIPFICSFVVHDLDSYSYGKKSVIDRLIYLHF